MGNTDTKLNFRKAVIQLTTKTQPIEAKDDVFWDQFWSESTQSAQDVFTLIPAAEIRALREESPSNLATLCYKAVEKLVAAADSLCNTYTQQQTVLNCVRLLTRILPYIFEEPDWRGFFWSSLPGRSSDETDDEAENMPLSQSLISALCDLLFCPDFTVSAGKKSGPDNPEDLQSIDSCEYIWEAGVGFAHTPTHVPQHDYNRTEILKLLLACFSQTMYMPAADVNLNPNKWIQYFTSADNRHALPLFTSLLNVVCAYDPVGYGVPFNHLLFTDSREPLVEVALQLLIVSLDHDFREPSNEEGSEKSFPSNLFINYLSRIHREEDFSFILKGFTRLLNNPLIQTYIPNSTKKVQFHQELLIFFWKMCDYNKKFMFYVLKSSEVLEVLVPILYHLNDARADQSRVGLVHIGVFILLLLSGERNFGVRLNKPYTASVPMDIPVFTGTHADLLIIVFHKIITTGHQRLQPLFDCLLTIIVNVSPYLKTLSMVASTKLLHLLEAFSTPWYLYTSATNHHLVFFLLEIFNNIIQYQFDGNSNLVYTIIRKRYVFHSLANLPTDHSTIQKSLSKRNKLVPSTSTMSLNSCASGVNSQSMEGSTPAKPAEKGTLNASLAATPCIDKMTERERAHPPSAPTSPTETSPPTLNDSGEETSCASKNPNTESSSQGLEPEGQEMINSNVTKEDSTCRKKPTSPPLSPTNSIDSSGSEAASTATNSFPRARASSAASYSTASSVTGVPPSQWIPTSDWVVSWKQKLPLQTIMRLLQVLVPQVEKICIDKGLTDESEILKFLQHGTLVGLLPVPHPILIRKYQANSGTTMWFRTYMWGVIYLRNVDPPIWYDTDVKLFEIQRI
ncbi:protein HID1 [Parasteatoda tepidariorum]|uniref:protein HID1 n=1 Tax=Parasteatoda tepidariorum TaxID=114398 RepID=UPI000A2C046D|nr:protein HID1 [Parasteatoda tepidariorum]